MNNNTNNGLDNISEIYKNLTYFDQYSGSVVIFLIITIVIGLIVTYCYIKINSQPVIDNWSTYRCKPYIIPFAGFITHPDGVSAMDYTSQNFTYCTQNILKDIMGGLLSPITFITNIQVDAIDTIADAINAIREMFNKLRTGLNKIIEDILSRIINLTVPLQEIFLGFSDLLHKTQGMMLTALYTFLGSYFTMKSTMGVIAKMILSILTILAAAVAGFWLIPPAWPLAIANTVIFTAISVPLAIILAFMDKSLHLNAGRIPKLKCFDKDTLILMNDGFQKRIIDIKPGDILLDRNIVTGVIKVETKGSIMYSLDEILVSDSHIVKYKNTWIPISKHPNAVKYAFYDKPYLYCLNTTNKQIIIKSHIFTDWDEIYDDGLLHICKSKCKNIKTSKNIHTYLDSGFIGSTPVILKNGGIKQIKDLEVGDILKNGERIYGIVKIDGTSVDKQYKYILNNNSNSNNSNNNIYAQDKTNFVIGGPNLAIYNETHEKILTIDLEIDKKIQVQMAEKEDILYHLLTDKKTFYINNILFGDYNVGIDTILDK
jgi:hypothetical protein